MLSQLWPQNPENLQLLPAGTDRQTWFENFVAEKRQHWQQKHMEYTAYGRLEDAQKERIKLEQLDLSLTQLSET
jgi:flagellar biosynthesis chaperone FliJ